MLAEERRSAICAILAETGAASVTELSRRLQVSGETIRRDIGLLDKQKRLRRTYGGALSMETTEPAFALRMSANRAGKQALGERAAALVPDGASVIIDFGTTAYLLAEALATRRRLTVFTSSIPAATRLAGLNGNRVFLLGGEFDGTEGTTLGRDATAMLANYVADFSFVGAGAISPHPWLLDYSREAAELRAQMLALARTPVILADHSKFNRLAPVRVANLDKAAYIVTDRHPDAETEAALSTLRAALLVADTAP
jgi:DeoR family transcriptional regulator, glycerol-3-phosphate regulon repressor